MSIFDKICLMLAHVSMLTSGDDVNNIDSISSGKVVRLTFVDERTKVLEESNQSSKESRYQTLYKTFDRTSKCSKP